MTTHIVVRLSAAPVRGRHSRSSVMIRILIWHRFFTPDALPDATLVASYDTGNKDWVSP